LFIVAIRIRNDLGELRVTLSKKMLIIGKIRLILVVCGQRLIEIWYEWTDKISNLIRIAFEVSLTYGDPPVMNSMTGKGWLIPTIYSTSRSASVNWAVAGS
jgi:hypothetical protein